MRDNAEVANIHKVQKFMRKIMLAVAKSRESGTKTGRSYVCSYKAHSVPERESVVLPNYRVFCAYLSKSDVLKDGASTVGPKLFEECSMLSRKLRLAGFAGASSDRTPFFASI